MKKMFVNGKAMPFEDYLKSKKNVILGYYIYDSMGSKWSSLGTPFPPDTLSDEELEELKDKLDECMPIYSMIMDLWDLDVHFEKDLTDDWYFEAVFGDDDSIKASADILAEIFLEHAEDLGLYNEFDEEELFEEWILEEAKKFIVEWREKIFEKLRN